MSSYKSIVCLNSRNQGVSSNLYRLIDKIETGSHGFLRFDQSSLDSLCPRSTSPVQEAFTIGHPRSRC
jgi:hypothetical protein